MHLITRALGALTGLVALTAPAALGVVVPATADDSPSLVVTPQDSPALPLHVYAGQPEAPGSCDGLDCSDGTNVAASVTATTTVTNVVVTITAQDGLNVLPQQPQRANAVGPDDPFYPEWAIGAQSPGFHTFSYEVTGDGVAPVDVTVPYLWRSGGPTLVGTGSLAGDLFGYNSHDYVQCGVESDCEFRTAGTLSFVDATHARFGLADQGRAGCARLHDCEPYEYDATHHLFQIGADHIGAVTPVGGWVDDAGWYRLLYPKVGQRLAGEWNYDVKQGWQSRGVGHEHLTLTRDARFTLAYSSTRGGSFSTRLHGTYRIGAHGALELVDRKRHLYRTETLALLTDAQGRPRASIGIWLGIHVDPKRGKDFLDGNRMLSTSRPAAPRR